MLLEYCSRAGILSFLSLQQITNHSEHREKFMWTSRSHLNHNTELLFKKAFSSFLPLPVLLSREKKADWRQVCGAELQNSPSEPKTLGRSPDKALARLQSSRHLHKNAPAGSRSLNAFLLHQPFWCRVLRPTGLWPAATSEQTMLH